MTFTKGQIPWNKGIKHTKGHTSFWLGKKLPLKVKAKMRLAHLGEKNHFYGKKHNEEAKQKMRGENNGNWRGGVSEEHHLIRESSDYKLWREIVKKRDNYTCVACGLKQGWNKNLKRQVRLQVDHIKPFALFPELRFAINNGRCLCEECHRKTETWGVNKIYQLARLK